jgi:hypothetical protein
MSTTKGPNTLNKIDLNIYAMELRTDNAYNPTTPILTCRLSNLNLRMNDIWKTITENEE